jgi:hypothetical protein
MIGYFKMLLYSNFQHDVCIQAACPRFVWTHFMLVTVKAEES